MAVEIKSYTNGQLYTLGRLDHALHLRHNLNQLEKVAIFEKRVFLHNQDDPKAEKEVRYPINHRLMYGIERVIWGLEATAIGMGLQAEVVDIVDKYKPKLNGRNPKV